SIIDRKQFVLNNSPIWKKTKTKAVQLLLQTTIRKQKPYEIKDNETRFHNAQLKTIFCHFQGLKHLEHQKSTSNSRALKLCVHVLSPRLAKPRKVFLTRSSSLTTSPMFILSFGDSIEQPSPISRTECKHFATFSFVWL
ncbi:hypothetical protein PanWU01x14_098000, partial [Parasponia andersonii]